MKSIHQEFKPSPALQPFVENYWLHSFEAANNQESPIQRCLPVGTLELILHLDDNPCQVLVNKQWQKLPQALLTGLYREAVHWKSVGTERKFGVQLKPESLLQLFKLPVASLFNDFTDLENIFGREINRLIDNVKDAPDIQTVIQTVEAFLLSKLRDANTGRNYLVEATRLIRQSKGNLSIEALSEQLYVSKRQLERSFKDNYGTSPKTYQRIIRFRNAYEYYHQTATAPDWLDISYTFGYSDQAHFIRDFKEFSDEVPTLLFQGNQAHSRTRSCWGLYVKP